MKTEIKSLQVKFGDCFFIKTFDNKGKEFSILIDGGPDNSYKIALRKELENKSIIDLLIITHIDDDHIKGINDFLDSSMADKIEIKNVLINAKNLKRFADGKELSYQSAIDFERKILRKYPDIDIYGDYVYDEGDKNCICFRAKSIKIKILSPNRKSLSYLYTEEDKRYKVNKWNDVDLKHLKETGQLCEPIKQDKETIPDMYELAQANDIDKKKYLSNDRYNASSLAFILETPDFKGLFLGDAWPSVIKTSLERIFNDFPVTFDLIKVSHHGSHYNTTKYLMELINSECYAISTDSSRFGHPDIEAVAKIICAPQRLDKTIKLWFNYELEHISKITDTQEENYNFKCEFDKQEIKW